MGERKNALISVRAILLALFFSYGQILTEFVNWGGGGGEGEGGC